MGNLHVGETIKLNAMRSFLYLDYVSFICSMDFSACADHVSLLSFLVIEVHIEKRRSE